MQISLTKRIPFCWGFLAFFFFACSAHAVTLSLTSDVSEANFGIDSPVYLQQADVVEFNLTTFENGDPKPLTNSAAFPVWYIAQETNLLNVAMMVTGEVVTATSGTTRISATSSNTAVLPGRYTSFVRLYWFDGSTNRYLDTLARNTLIVRQAADASSYTIVPPIPFADLLYFANVRPSTNVVFWTNTVSGVDYLMIAATLQGGGSGDMTKSVYDTNSNDVVDNAEALGGTLAAAYATDVELASQTTLLWSAISSEQSARIAATATNGTNIALVGSVASNGAVVANVATTAAANAQSTANTATTRVGSVEADLAGLIRARWSNSFVFAGVTNPQPCGLQITRGTNDSHVVTGCMSLVTWSNPAAVSASGAWSSNIVFAGTTATSPCGMVITFAYSGTNSMQQTGCVAYLTIVDTNGPAAVGGTATNYTIVYNGTTNIGAAIVLSTGGSITNVLTTNGQIVVQSKDDTGAGASNPGFTDYFHVQLNAAGAAAWTITAGTWLTGQYNVVRNNDQGVWKTNSYTWVYTSTGLVFACFHIQPYHAAGYRYAVLYRNGVQFLGVSEDYNSASGQYFDFGGSVIWENTIATNVYSAVFFSESTAYPSALSDGQTNLEYIVGGRFQ